MAKSAGVYICDICGEDTKEFRYWEGSSSPFGTIINSYLAIDTCKSCTDKIRHNIPDNMMIDKNMSKILTQKEIKVCLEEWKDLIL